MVYPPPPNTKVAKFWLIIFLKILAHPLKLRLNPPKASPHKLSAPAYNTIALGLNTSKTFSKTNPKISSYFSSNMPGLKGTLIQYGLYLCYRLYIYPIPPVHGKKSS